MVRGDQRAFGSATPDDPLFDELESLKDINVEAAWDLTTGSRGVVVGVIDSGVDYRHP